MDIHSIEESVRNFPLPLLDINSNKLRKVIDSYLPYSVGIEIECLKSKDFETKLFSSIKNIIDVNCDDGEQRFRIPNKLEGLVCLYNICELLNKYSILNPGSGIHYHIDMTDWFDLLSNNNPNEFIGMNKEWILKELDTWEYRGTFNSRDILFNGSHNYIRFQNCFKTAEFRIGEMSFDYNILVNRIIHANNIIKKLKTRFYKYLESQRLFRLERDLEDMKKEEKNEDQITQEDMKKIITNRIIKYGRK